MTRNADPSEFAFKWEGDDLSNALTRAMLLIGGRNPATNLAEQLQLNDGALAANIGAIVDGRAIYSASRGDFVATANTGAKTVTLSALVGNIATLSKIMILAVLVDGVPAPLINATVAGFVITVADWPENFAGTEVVDVILAGVPRAYESLTDAILTSPVGKQLGITEDGLTVVGAGYDPGDDLEHTMYREQVSGYDYAVFAIDLDDDASYAVAGDEEFRIFTELVSGSQIVPRYAAAAGNPDGVDWNGALTSSTAGVFIVETEGNGGDIHVVFVPLNSVVNFLSWTCKVCNGMSFTMVRALGKR